jgi:hypothetical protein
MDNTTAPLTRNSRRFQVTFFKDRFATSLRTRDMTLHELREQILRTTAHKKSLLPWLKCAVFGRKRSEANSLRHDENVEAISGVELDYDNEEVPLEQGAQILKRAGLLSLLYTSPSHSDAKPRWRVLLPTSRDLPPQQRRNLVARVNHVCGGIFAPESFALSQSYYFGAVNNNLDHRVIIIAGDYIDQRDDLAAGIKSDAAPKKPNGRRRRRSGTKRHDDACDPFASLARDQVVTAPIDIDERLAQMQYRGKGETCIHLTQLSVTAALLRRGYSMSRVVARVMRATRSAAGREGRRWNWRREERDVRAMCKSWLAKHPVVTCRDAEVSTRHHLEVN